MPVAGTPRGEPGSADVPVGVGGSEHIAQGQVLPAPAPVRSSVGSRSYPVLEGHACPRPPPARRELATELPPVSPRRCGSPDDPMSRLSGRRPRSGTGSARRGATRRRPPTAVAFDGPSPHVHTLPGMSADLGLTDLWYTGDDAAARPRTPPIARCGRTARWRFVVPGGAVPARHERLRALLARDAHR